MSQRPAPTEVTKYKCNSCETLYDDEQPPLRQCSRESCGDKVFVSDDRACPDCNSTFSRRLAKMGCESCESEDGEIEEVKLWECHNDGCDHDGSEGFHDDLDEAIMCGIEAKA